MPMAIACFRFFTLRLPADFSLPPLYSRMTLPTLFSALRLYLRCPLLLELEEDERLDFFLAEVERPVLRCDDLLRPCVAVVPRRLPEAVLRRRPVWEPLDRRVFELDLRAVAISI